MKKSAKILGFFGLLLITGLVFTGCLGLITGNTLVIRTDGNLSSVVVGGSLRFNVNNQGVIWSVSSTRDGTGPVSPGTFITSNGVLTIGLDETSTVIFVIATSTTSDLADYKQIRIVTVNSVSVSPSNQTVVRGRTFQFRASVSGTNDPDNEVTWRVSSNASGTGAVTPGTNINASGMLSITRTETLTTLYVIANSVVDPTKSGSVPVNVVIPVVYNVSVSAADQSVISGRTLQCSATVTGTNSPDTSVTWRVSTNAAGTGAVTPGTSIGGNGLLTVAPNETARMLYVFANSVEDPSKSGSVIINVLVPTVTGVSVSPANQSVTRGRTLQFNASVIGNNSPDTAVTWRVSSNADGTGAATRGTSVSNSGLLTVSANETVTTLYVFATSVADPTKSGGVAVRVIIPSVDSISVSPSDQSVFVGGSLQFRVSVVGNNNPDASVTWRVSSNAAGTGAVARGTSINNNGMLSVSANETATTLYITATSAADPTKSAGVTVNIIIPAVNDITVSPSGQSVFVGGTLQFRASVTGSNNPNQAVTWKVSSNAAGTGGVTRGTSINNNGLLSVSANETATTLYVTATSVADSTKSDNVAVTIIIPSVSGVNVSPAGQTVERGKSFQFNASVVGNNNPSQAVTWKVSSNAAGTGAVTRGTSINNNGRLTVSATETATTLFIIATSAADPTRSGSVTVNVPAPAAVTPTVTSVSISPSGQSVTAGSAVQLNATVTGANGPSPAVTWRVSSNAAGTGPVVSGTGINSNGVLTVSSNEAAQTLYIIATSVTDPTKSGMATVTVNKPATDGQNNQLQNNQGQNSQGQNNQGQNSQGQNNQWQNNQGQNNQGQRPGQNQNDQGQNRQ